MKPSLVGYADLDLGEGLRKGGFGAYRFSNERANNPKFKWMRKAIQEQNPSPGYQTIDWTYILNHKKNEYEKIN